MALSEVSNNSDQFYCGKNTQNSVWKQIKQKIFWIGIDK